MLPKFVNLTILAISFALAVYIVFMHSKKVKAVEQFENQKVSPDYSLYRSILDTYNQVLDRYATPQELYEAADKMKQDPTFTVEKLKTQLLSSDENSRRVKTQTNYASDPAVTPEAITDQQSVFVVTKVYKEIYGENKEPPQTELDYYKKKYVEFGSNEEKLKNFIVSTKEISQKEPPSVQEPAPEVKKTEKKPEQKKKIEKYSEPKQFQRPSIYNFYTAPGAEETLLSDRKNSRDEEELKFACQRSRVNF
jgi:hypothetical protein